MNKFLIIILAITAIALLYVYQQSKIIEMAYAVQERLAFLDSCLNNNNNLKYLINRQMSLVSIADIWQGGDFEWPNQKQLVSFSGVRQVSIDNVQIKTKENIFTRIFGLRSQAEATLVNPQ